MKEYTFYINNKKVISLWAENDCNPYEKIDADELLQAFIEKADVEVTDED